MANKERIQRMNTFLVEKIEDLSKLQVFEDAISEQTLKEIQESTGGRNYFIYETGGFRKGQQKNQMNQIILLRFYSEKRDDLDEFSLDLIDALEGNLYEFQYSNKTAYRISKEDNYVDEIEFYFIRKFINGC